MKIMNSLYYDTSRTRLQCCTNCSLFLDESAKEWMKTPSCILAIAMYKPKFSSMAILVHFSPCSDLGWDPDICGTSARDMSTVGSRELTEKLIEKKMESFPGLRLSTETHQPEKYHKFRYLDSLTDWLGKNAKICSLYLSPRASDSASIPWSIWFP